MQGKPLPVMNGVIGVITPVTHWFSAIYRSYSHSIYNDLREAHLVPGDSIYDPLHPRGHPTTSEKGHLQ